MRGVRFLPLALSALLLACRVATSDTAGESRHAFASLCAATNAAAGLQLTATKLLAEASWKQRDGAISSDAVKTALTTRGTTEACWEAVADAWWARNATGPWLAQLKHTVALAATARDASKHAAAQATELSKKTIYGTAEAELIRTFARDERANRGQPDKEGGDALAKDISYLCGKNANNNAHACIVEATAAAVTGGENKFWAEYAKTLCMEDATPASSADARAAIRNWQSILATAKASAQIKESEHFTFGKTESVNITLTDKKAVVAWRTSLEEAASAMEEAASNNTGAEGMLSQAVAQASAFCQHVAQEGGKSARRTNENSTEKHDRAEEAGRRKRGKPG
ncbi:hypothetical protein ERJ75_000368100 [Trypanosoma vivax]|nr:hypothetical protein ERJ75_000368100 [Trypanosoma vivax]